MRRRVVTAGRSSVKSKIARANQRYKTLDAIKLTPFLFMKTGFVQHVGADRNLTVAKSPHLVVSVGFFFFVLFNHL